jgi:hypothetical protein
VANPTNATYCKVTGRFRTFVADGADSDDIPDFVALTGTGSITMNANHARNTGAGAKEFYLPSEIPVIVDGQGLLTHNGNPYVMLLAPASDVVPTNFNYTISLTLTASGETVPRRFGPYPFNVVSGGVIDLADALPVPSNSGVWVTKGEPGEVSDANVAAVVAANASAATAIDTMLNTRNTVNSSAFATALKTWVTAQITAATGGASVTDATIAGIVDDALTSAAIDTMLNAKNTANTSAFATALKTWVSGQITTAVAGVVTTVTAANAAPLTTLTVTKSAGVWPARPTSRSDIIVQWKGADPSPAIVSTGTGGMRDNIDIRLVTP